MSQQQGTLANNNNNNSSASKTSDQYQQQHANVMLQNYTRQPFLLLNYAYNTVETENLKKVLGKLGEQNVWQIWHAYKKLIIDQNNAAGRGPPTGPEFQKDKYQQSTKTLQSTGAKYTIAAIDKYIDDIYNAKATTLININTAQQAEQAHTVDIITNLCKKQNRHNSGNKGQEQQGTNAFNNLSEKINDALTQFAEIQKAINLASDSVKGNTTLITENTEKIDANAKDIFDTKERVTKVEADILSIQTTSKQQVTFLQSQIDNLQRTINNRPNNVNDNRNDFRNRLPTRIRGGIKTDKLIQKNVTIVASKIPNEDEFNVEWLIRWIRIPSITLKQADFELLKPTVHTRTDPYPTKSYKITFKTNLTLESILEKDNFPEGILVSRFRFPRNNGFRRMGNGAALVEEQATVVRNDGRYFGGMNRYENVGHAH